MNQCIIIILWNGGPPEWCLNYLISARENTAMRRADTILGFLSIRRYRDIDRGCGNPAIIVAPRYRTIS